MSTRTKRPLPVERTHFRELYLRNHFDTIRDSPLAAVAAAAGNTTYEEVVCVGYQPQFRRLHAVVHLKQDGGYSGGICTNGSTEYVKFFTSADDGATWIDRGTTSFQAHDVPGDKPLEYAVSLDTDFDEWCCHDEQLLLIRAILSWEVPPTGPDDAVVWGNSVDSRIQVEPISSGPIWKLFHCLKIEVDLPELSELVELEQPVAFGNPKALKPVELAKHYAERDVPPDRFLLPEIQKLIKHPFTLVEKAQLPGPLFPEIDIDIGPLIDVLLDPPGNTAYEELGCVGLDPRTSELVAVLDVKQSSGYSGSLCTAGSHEFVAFWVDWGDGAGWEYAGTTSVNVHDLANVPGEGVRYAAFLPFAQLAAHRQPCSDGPKVARLRAILSWEYAPPPWDPEWSPVWGNRAETLILIPPGAPVTGHAPFIESIGGMAVAEIDSVTGRASGPAVSAGFVASDSPFGGLVSLCGHIANPADVLGGGAPPMKYKIWLSSDGGATWSFLSTTFPIWTTDLVGGVWQPQVRRTQAPDAQGFYTYYEDLTGTSMRFVAQNVLAQWQTAGNDQWLVYMEARDAATNVVLGTTPQKRVQLDNTRPTASVEITSGGGSCADFHPGDVIDGSYEATDNETFHSVSLSVDPSSPGPIGTITFGPVGPQPPVGARGEWHLQTSPAMPPCGYVLRMVATDSTIVDSGYVGWSAGDAAGFCIRK